MNQNQLYAAYLDDAVTNVVTVGLVRYDRADDLPESELTTGFHTFMAGRGSPFSDRAEAAEVALDAVASAISGSSWSQWLEVPSHELGKQAYRAEALILVTAIAQADADAAEVRDWYASRSGIWDDPGYDRSSSVAEAMQRIDELSGVAASRPDGTLYALTEE